MKLEDCRIGMNVFFGRDNGEKTLGEIIKVNRTKIKIRQIGERGTQRNHSAGTVWTVPPSLCTPAEEGRPHRVTKRAANRPCLVNVLTGKRTYGYAHESHDSLFGRLANQD
tara:strand:+ start:91 stop:423 length:333 start_codon:yes stop_codon:yes gene_type:complete